MLTIIRYCLQFDIKRTNETKNSKEAHENKLPLLSASQYQKERRKIIFSTNIESLGKTLIYLTKMKGGRSF